MIGDSSHTRIWCCLAGAEAEWFDPHSTLAEAFDADKLNRILQFLPCLLASPGDQILLHNPPADPSWSPPKGVELLFDSPLQIRQHPPSDEIWLWAQSRAASNWFGLPDRTTLMRKLASKATLIEWGLAPQGSRWITSLEQLRPWLTRHPGPAVAKRALHSSGRGHLLLPQSIDDSQAVLQRLALIMEKDGGVILQPWWKRLLDFSSQWWCGSSHRYVGSTIMHNSPRGRYLGSTVGPHGWLENLLGEHWTEHVAQCHRALQHAAALGYTGPIGIDAMFVDGDQGPTLVPIVELNPRHTMGWLACTLQKNRPQSWLRFDWVKSHQTGLLPSEIVSYGKPERLGIQPHLSWANSPPLSSIRFLATA